jgi:hypothetical protein
MVSNNYRGFWPTTFCILYSPMKAKSPFATSLVLAIDEEPDARALELIQSFRASPGTWILEGVDATGTLGGQLTKEINASGYKRVSHAEFCELLGEAGQVIEVDALALGKDHELLARIEIADGSILHWFGFGDPAEEASPGDFRREDCELFDWPGGSLEVLRSRALDFEEEEEKPA